MDKEEIILKTDDKAAKFVTGISGWVASNGQFCGDNEALARYVGCTHVKCEKCGEIHQVNSYCRPCADKKQIEKFNNMERKEWDGKIPLYSDSHDEYFFDEGYLRDYIHDHNLSINDLNLILCEPVMMNNLEEEYFLENLHEDAELPQEMITAIDNLNELINSLSPQTWYPGKYAAVVSD